MVKSFWWKCGHSSLHHQVQQAALASFCVKVAPEREKFCVRRAYISRVRAFSCTHHMCYPEKKTILVTPNSALLKVLQFTKICFCWKIEGISSIFTSLLLFLRSWRHLSDGRYDYVVFHLVVLVHQQWKQKTSKTVIFSPFSGHYFFKILYWIFWTFWSGFKPAYFDNGKCFQIFL